MSGRFYHSLSNEVKLTKREIDRRLCDPPKRSKQAKKSLEHFDPELSKDFHQFDEGQPDEAGVVLPFHALHQGDS